MAERIPGVGENPSTDGWVSQGDGLYTPAKYPVTFVPGHFQEHAEISRARWNIEEILKAGIQKILHKQTPR
jgi:hypothetical protein